MAGPMKPKGWTHIYVCGERVTVVPGAPKVRRVWEDKRPSGTPDQRGTIIEIGPLPVPAGPDDTRARVGQRQAPPPKEPPRARRYVIGAAVKNVTLQTVRYRVYEVAPDTPDLAHEHIVAAVRQAPHQVATLLRELLGSTYAIAGAIGIVAPPHEERRG